MKIQQTQDEQFMYNLKEYQNKGVFQVGYQEIKKLYQVQNDPLIYVENKYTNEFLGVSWNQHEQILENNKYSPKSNSQIALQQTIKQKLQKNPKQLGVISYQTKTQSHFKTPQLIKQSELSPFETQQKNKKLSNQVNSTTTEDFFSSDQIQIKDNKQIKICDQQHIETKEINSQLKEKQNIDNMKISFKIQCPFDSQQMLLNNQENHFQNIQQKDSPSEISTLKIGLQNELLHVTKHPSKINDSDHQDLSSDEKIMLIQNHIEKNTFISQDCLQNNNTHILQIENDTKQNIDLNVLKFLNEIKTDQKDKSFLKKVNQNQSLNKSMIQLTNKSYKPVQSFKFVSEKDNEEEHQQYRSPISRNLQHSLEQLGQSQNLTPPFGQYNSLNQDQSSNGLLIDQFYSLQVMKINNANNDTIQNQQKINQPNEHEKNEQYYIQKNKIGHLTNFSPLSRVHCQKKTISASKISQIQRKPKAGIFENILSFQNTQSNFMMDSIKEKNQKVQ